MSDTNRVALAYVQESSFGSTVSTPTYKALRITGTPNLAYAPQTVVSDEIRSDRQITDLVLVGAEAGGDINAELAFDTLTDLLEAGLQDTWTVRPTIVNTAADTEITGVTDSTDTISVASGGTVFKANHLIKTTDFTNSANNGIFKLTASITATTLKLSGTPSLTDEAAPPSGARIRAIGVEGDSGDITATAGATNSVGSTSLDFTTFSLVAGDWIKLGGATSATQFATAANNDWVRISVVAANKLTLDRVPSGWTTDNGSGKTIRFYIGDRLRNGTTERSFNIERRFLDHSPVTYELFRGMEVDTIRMDIPAKQVAKVSIGFVGKDAVVSNSRVSGASDESAATDTPFNTSSNVGQIGEGGSAVTTPNYVLESTIEINNNLRRQDAVGSLGSVGIGVGEFGCSGTLQTYFGDKTLLDKVLNNTETSYDIRFEDSSNQIMLIDLPRVKFSSGAPDVAGKNQDAVIPLGFQAIRHSTLGYTMQIQKFWDIEQ